MQSVRHGVWLSPLSLGPSATPAVRPEALEGEAGLLRTGPSTVLRTGPSTRLRTGSAKDLAFQNSAAGRMEKIIRSGEMSSMRAGA